VSARTPSYRLHKPSGQAVVTLNGRDIYLGLHGTKTSKAAYDRAVAEWLANGRRVEPRHEATVSEIIVKYLDHVDGYYTSNEPRNIRLAIKPLRRLYGMTAAREFGPLALKAIRQTFLEGDLSRGEVNKRTRPIVRLFKWSVAEELIPASVLHALKAVEGILRGRGDVRESAPVKPVPDADMDAIRPFVSRQVWAMIELQRLTGMRPGEACQMRTCDINTQGRIWEYRPQTWVIRRRWLPRSMPNWTMRRRSRRWNAWGMVARCADTRMWLTIRVLSSWWYRNKTIRCIRSPATL
jgi:integrase